MTIANGSGDLLPDPSVDGEFNLVIYNESAIGVVTTYDGGSTDTRQDLADTNPEIVRVTARSGDVLTVTRGQEGTTASAKEAGNTYRVILSATKKIFDDIQTAIDNVNVTNLTGVESLVFDTTGDEEFGLPAGTTAQRPASPSQGYMRYNTDDGIGVEVYNGSRWVSLGAGFAQLALEVAELSVTANDGVASEVVNEVEYLVIAGGGGGGAGGAGGGAGGYRSSVTGESSGGGASAESTLIFGTDITTSTNYTVTVGAGGAGKATSPDGLVSAGSSGSNSVFNTITSTGGGGGGSASGLNDSGLDGLNGGSGGGAAQRSAGGLATEGSGTASQGFDGGTGNQSTAHQNGGGGGAGSVGGEPPSSSVGADGGSGVSSSITGSSVGRAGGGGAGVLGSNTAGGATDGGGAGANNSNTGSSGSTNSGGGGGGGGILNAPPYTRYGGGSGGSGVVILRYPSNFSITVGAGLTASTATVGGNKITTFTAGTDTISFS